MKFILQDSKLIRDFENELLWSEAYWNWYNKGKPKDLRTEIKVISEKDIIGLSIEDKKDLCPVGSIEFVVNWLKKIHNKTPKPINVPEVFIKESLINCGREIINLSYDFELPQSFLGQKLYVKSNEIIKHELNGEYDSYTLKERIKGNVQVSTVIENILSESRVFVYKNNILDCKTYSGDPFINPNKDDVERLIKIYELQSPISYTLDVVNVLDDNIIKSYILEVHDFFSCGLYGFSNYKYYPFMLYRWFKNFINKQ